MKRGFTVLELLVASLLLGMLMTILTMVFSQSSIAWRTGIATVANFDDAREEISEVRYKADNSYVFDNKLKYVVSVFNDDQGGLRQRTVEDNFYGKEHTSYGKEHTSFKVDTTVNSGDAQNSTGVFNPSSQGKESSENSTYVVNVMSAGPDRNYETKYDNIWSVPNDPQDW